MTCGGEYCCRACLRSLPQVGRPSFPSLIARHLTSRLMLVHCVCEACCLNSLALRQHRGWRAGTPRLTPFGGRHTPAPSKLLACAGLHLHPPKLHKVLLLCIVFLQALLDAGAAIVGKNVMDEMAYSLGGDNAHYGTPVNPAAPGRLPGGSSSGTAAAVAAGEADLGLGGPGWGEVLELGGEGLHTSR